MSIGLFWEGGWISEGMSLSLMAVAPSIAPKCVCVFGIGLTVIQPRDCETGSEVLNVVIYFSYQFRGTGLMCTCIG